MNTPLNSEQCEEERPEELAEDLDGEVFSCDEHLPEPEDQKRAERSFSIFMAICLLAIAITLVHANLSGVGNASAVTISEIKTSDSTRQPHPSLSPAQVVYLQLLALQTHGAAEEGVRQCYQFASPANRRAIGSLDAFAEVLRADAYSPMLKMAGFELGPLQRMGDTSVQPVRIRSMDGRTLFYSFMLRIQADPLYNGCWMTEGVAGPFTPGELKGESESPQKGIPL